MPNIAFGYKQPQNSGWNAFKYIVTPVSAIRPGAAFWKLELASTPYETELALRDLPHTSEWTASKPEMIAEKLGELDPHEDTPHMYLYSPGINDPEQYPERKLRLHQYDLEHRIWFSEPDFQLENAEKNMTINIFPNLQESICGTVQSCFLNPDLTTDLGFADQFLFPEIFTREITRSDLFESCTGQLNCSPYATDDPRSLLLYTLPGACKIHSCTYKPFAGTVSLNWPSKAEEYAEQILQNGSFETQLYPESDRALPGKLLIAALQCEADRRIKKSFPDYDPASEADQTRISLQVYDLLNAVMPLNFAFGAFHKIAVTSQYVSNLADLAEISWKDRTIKDTQSAENTCKTGAAIKI